MKFSSFFASLKGRVRESARAKIYSSLANHPVITHSCLKACGPNLFWRIWYGRLDDSGRELVATWRLRKGRSGPVLNDGPVLV